MVEPPQQLVRLQEAMLRLMGQTLLWRLTLRLTLLLLPLVLRPQPPHQVQLHPPLLPLLLPSNLAMRPRSRVGWKASQRQAR